MATLESKVLFMTPEVGDEATFENESSPLLPISNLTKSQPTDIWRTSKYTSGDTAFFEMDLGSALSFDFVCCLFANQTTGTASWRVRTATSQANLTSSPSHDSGTLTWWESNAAMATASSDFTGWDRTHAFYDFGGTTQQKQWVRIDIWDDNSVDMYTEMGRFYLGLKYQPTINALFGSSVPFPKEEVKRFEAQGGLLHNVARPRRRSFKSTLQFNDVDELMQNLYEIARLRGSSQDILYLDDPTSRWAIDGLVYGVLTSPMDVSIPDYDFWSLRVGMQEML